MEASLGTFLEEATTEADAAEELPAEEPPAEEFAAEELPAEGLPEDQLAQPTSLAAESPPKLPTQEKKCCYWAGYQRVRATKTYSRKAP